MRAIPTINTSRLTLRAMRPEDFDRYATIWADEDVMHFVGGKARSRAESWRSFLANAGQWQMTGIGQWAIEDHGLKRMVGQVGFFNAAREFGADFDAYPEAGWLLAREAQGRGLGPEAAEAAHDWFDRVVTGPAVCMIDPKHRRSLKLAQALGYKPLRETGPEDSALLLIRKSPPG